MKFNLDQRKAIYGEEPLIVVAAGAGSGKTKVLSERYVFLCDLQLRSELGLKCNEEIGAEVSDIVTLTFTEDAALEMKDRIRKRLIEKRQNADNEYPEHSSYAIGFWKKQIEGLDNAIISTFHSFCQRIVTENSFEANVYPDAGVMDVIQSKLLKAEIFSELLDEGEITGQWQVLLNNIHPIAFQESLFSVYGKVKEYELPSSLQEALKVDALIEQWKLEKEEALEQFQSNFYTFFQSNPDVSKLTKANKDTFNALLQVFQQNVKGMELILSIKNALLSKKSVPKNVFDQNSAFAALFQECLTARDQLSQPEEHQVLLEAILNEFQSFFLNFDERYEEKKREAALLDFSDLQQKAIQLLSNPDTQQYYSSQYKHFLVDEFQDTNQLQLRMIEKINPAYRFIVGDGKQSIYRFRGADVQLLNGLAREARDNPGYSFVDMNTNYRTCDSIIKFVNLLFQQDELMGTNLDESAPLYKTEYSSLEAFRNDDKCSQSRVEYIKVTETQEESQNENQYGMIARRMVQLEKNKTEVFDKDEGVWCPVEWRDMSVLMASRTDLTVLERALKDLDIPYNVYGGLGFYNRQEVIDFLSLLRWLNKPYEPLFIMAVLRSPMFGVTMDEFLEIRHSHGEESTMSTFIYENQFRNHSFGELNEKLERFCRLYERWAPFRWTGRIREDLLTLFEESDLKTVLFLQKNNLMKIKNVEKLIDTITGLNAKSMDELLTKVAVLADLSEKEGDAEVELTGGNFVHIMTVHGSKGLEFPVVFVPNLSRGLLSDKETFRYDYEGGLSVKFEVENGEDILAKGIGITSPNFDSLSTLSKDQAVEESKRLFYVALTRARDLLILTSTYKEGEEKEKRKKDTWYKWLEDALDNNEKMMEYISILEDIPEEKAVVEAANLYEGPSIKIQRSIPITFSVSEVMSYMNDPEGFFEKHILKLDPIWFEELDDDDQGKITNLDEKLENEVVYNQEGNPIKATVLGTLVHRICELLDLGYQQNDAYREAFTILKPEDDEELYRKRIAPLIDSYQKKDFGTPIDNEWDFVLDIDGVQIIGEIDKVVKKDNRLEVIDLKTNVIRENIDELIQYYKPQLYLYKMAYENHNKVKVDGMSLAFLRDSGQGIYQLKHDQSYELQLKKAIKEMVEAKAWA